jgi:hypothetical protein
VKIDKAGIIQHRADIVGKNADFIKWSTPTKQLSSHIMTDPFKMYLEKRYSLSP